MLALGFWGVTGQWAEVGAALRERVTSLTVWTRFNSFSWEDDFYYFIDWRLLSSEMVSFNCSAYIVYFIWGKKLTDALFGLLTVV